MCQSTETQWKEAYRRWADTHYTDSAAKTEALEDFLEQSAYLYDLLAEDGE